MHVYLKNGEQKRWLIVELTDGHVPKLTGISGNQSQLVTDTLEPAIWFKIIVIDSVSIDCQKHVVSWNINSGHAEENDDSNGTQYTMFDDDDQSCYDFDDDLDELYDLAMFLVKSNPMAILNEVERNDEIREYERCLFRLLHCYILGKIKLHPEDIEQVSFALAKQLQAISSLEELMLMHKRVAEQYLNQMRELLESRILPFFQQILSYGGCSQQVITLLKENIVKDLAKVTNEVDVAQRKVDQMKKEMEQGATSSSFSDALTSARGRRDMLVTKMHELLEWREMLTVQERLLGNTAVNGPMEPVLLRYLELNEEVQREKQEAKILCDKKLLAVSVRVSIESALSDLRQGQVTVGEEMTTDGQRSTDVMIGNGANAEWQTLGERLSTILHNPENPAGQSFQNFVFELNSRFGEIFRMYERMSDSNSIAEVDGYLVVGNRNVDFMQYLDDIKFRVHRHLDESTAFLVDLFQNNSRMFWRKLRLGYEKCLFRPIGDNLIRLYRITNGNIMLDLERRVMRLKDFPVCKLGLQMKQEWWLSLFEPVTITNCQAIRHCQESPYDFYQSEEMRPVGDSRVLSNDSVCSQHLNEITDGVSPTKCYKNIDLMREKLQVGTAKVLSRSWSDFDIPTSLKDNPIRTGANVMVKEIGSVVQNPKSFISYDKIFGSLKKNMRSYTITNKVNKLAPVPSTHGRRDRSRSTPNMLSCDGNMEFDQTEFRNDLRNSAKYTIGRKDSFKRHFGEVISGIRNVFTASSPLNKMQCLTASLRAMASTVMELRRQKYKTPTDEDDMSYAVTAEDLLPLIVLMLLKLEPAEVGKLFVEMCFISDMMDDFLSSGCHSYALTEFQIGFRVLSQTCEELDIA